MIDCALDAEETFEYEDWLEMVDMPEKDLESGEKQVDTGVAERCGELESRSSSTRSVLM